MNTSANGTVKVGACQVPEIREDPDEALSWIERFAREADEQGIDLLCFPECFLQGYITEDVDQARRYALDLSAEAYNRLLDRLKHVRTMLVFGLIEIGDGKLYNTAVVVKQGRQIGHYRKTHLLEGESIFESGDSYPTFDAGGLTFGINICYDTNFPETAAALADQDARLILCPANNMMKYDKAEQWKERHNEVRARRAAENGVWLISADVTGERDGCISYGPTAVINPEGRVVSQVPLLETGMVVTEIEVR